MKTLCDLLAIEVMDAPAPAALHHQRAPGVGPACSFSALAAGRTHHYEDNLAGQRGNGAGTAGDYRAEVMRRLSRRQAARLFHIERSRAGAGR